MTKATTAANARTAKPDAQSERFKQAALELECDEDEACCDERLRKMAKHEPVEDKPPSESVMRGR